MPSSSTSLQTGRFLLSGFGAEMVGLACGGAFLSTFSWLSFYFEHPGHAMVALAVFASTAGVIIGGLAASLGEIPALAARQGGRAAMWAAITGAVCLVLAARTVPGSFAPRRALMVMAAATVPAMFAGSIAATLAAVRFRRLVETPPVYEEWTFLCLCYRWLLRGLLLCGIAAALAAPFFPTNFPIASLRAASPKPFRYATPEVFKSASPVAWRLHASRNLGFVEQSRGLALSHDQRLVAGMADHRTVVAHDLESDARWRIGPVPHHVKHSAFSPDGKRLFFVLDADPLGIAVGILETGRFIPLPQPKRHAVPDSAAVWDKENSVSFPGAPGGPKVLDLLSLELDPLSLSGEEAEALERLLELGLAGNDRWGFRPISSASIAELPETAGSRDWTWLGRRVLCLSDRRHPVSRHFPEIEIADADRLISARDGSKILRLRNDNLEVFYFDARPVPPLRWRITLPHGPERMRAKEETALALARGTLSLSLYSPLINPLTQKTIGPDRERMKSVLRVERWEGTEADVWVESIADPYSAGDVFADFHIPGATRMLLEFDQPHRWWLAASEPAPDASDVGKLPDSKEAAARVSEALAKEREAKESGADTAAAMESEAPPAPPAAGAGPPRPLKKSLTIDDVLSPEPGGNPPENAVDYAEVRSFVLTHHEKISRGKVAEMVADYAPRVDHFKNGMVTRDFILKDELAYHRQYSFIHEKVRGGLIRVLPVGPGWCEARYLMDNEWRMPDGRAGKGAFLITLGLERQRDGWRIINQRSETLE